MRKIICALNLTADGYCDHLTVVADEEHHQLSNELLDRADVVVLGRVTYALFESFWPNAKDDATLPGQMLEFAGKINAIRKIVISKTLSCADWNNSIVISDIRQLSLLKQQPGKDIVILGSPGLVSILSKRKLIDEYHFSIQPIIAGKGKRLFGEIVPEERLNLRLTGTRTFKSGVVTLFYSIKKE
jgi:dihydrofolate reductase